MVKETGQFEHQQGLEYQVECLNTELQHTKMLLAEAEANKVTQRSEEDIAQLAHQEDTIGKLKTATTRRPTRRPSTLRAG